jgi:hypothetical protein
VVDETPDERSIAEQLADEERLANELADYRGRWVAVHRSQVVASASTLAELLAQARQLTVDGVFQVPWSDHLFLVAA